MGVAWADLLAAELAACGGVDVGALVSARVGREPSRAELEAARRAARRLASRGAGSLVRVRRGRPVLVLVHRRYRGSARELLVAGAAARDRRLGAGSAGWAAVTDSVQAGGRRSVGTAWVRLLAAAVAAQGSVVVRDVVVVHLGREPTRSEMSAARRAAASVARSGRATVHHRPDALGKARLYLDAVDTVGSAGSEPVEGSAGGGAVCGDGRERRWVPWRTVIGRSLLVNEVVAVQSVAAAFLGREPTNAEATAARSAARALARDGHAVVSLVRPAGGGPAMLTLVRPGLPLERQVADAEAAVRRTRLERVGRRRPRGEPPASSVGSVGSGRVSWQSVLRRALDRDEAVVVRAAVVRYLGRQPSRGEANGAGVAAAALAGRGEAVGLRLLAPGRGGYRRVLVRPGVASAVRRAVAEAALRAAAGDGSLRYAPHTRGPETTAR